MTKLLIIRLSALGDVAMLVPVVKVLASQHSDLQITVLSQKFLRPLFEDIADNVHFIGFDKKGEHKGFFGVHRLYRQLKAENFTHIADCHDVLRTKQLRMRFSLSSLLKGNAKIAHIDKHRDGKKALTQEENKHIVQQPTSFENYAETIDKVLGTNLLEEIKNLNDFKNLHCSKNQSTENPKLKTQNPLIGFAPFAAHAGKIYPLWKSLEVVKLLLSRGAKVYLFGAGEKEMAVFKDWQNQCAPLIEKGEDEWAGEETGDLLVAADVLKAENKKGFKAELELMSQLDCMISMDSGNMHLASIVGTRVVSIWGATHPLAGFLGWQQNPADCVQKEMPCRPCSIYGNKPCKLGDYPCLNNISPEEIVKKCLAKKTLNTKH